MRRIKGRSQRSMASRSASIDGRIQLWLATLCDAWSYATVQEFISRCFLSISASTEASKDDLSGWRQLFKAPSCSLHEKKKHNQLYNKSNKTI